MKLLLICIIMHSDTVFANSTTIQLPHPISSVDAGDSFQVNVTVANVANLHGWEFKLFFLNTVVNCSDVTEGPFLKSVGGTIFGKNITNVYNSTHGRILAYCSILGSATVAGNGTLATITLYAKAAGQTPLDLRDTKLADGQVPSQPIPHTATDGTVTVAPPPGQVLDVYTQRGGVGVNNPSDAFSPGETIFFYGSLVLQGSPVPGVIVQFKTYDPHGTLTLRTAVTNDSGIAKTSITLSSTPVFGGYYTNASATVQEQEYNDTVTFQVGWKVSISWVIPCSCSGNNQTSFVKGTHAYFNISLENICFTPRLLFVLVDVTDSQSGQVATGWMQFMIPHGKTKLILGFRIPAWSATGQAQGVINVLNRAPWSGGSPYSPEKIVTLNILGG